MNTRKHPIMLGSETKYGKVRAVGYVGNERYYWMVDKNEVVSMLPAITVETEEVES